MVAEVFADPELLYAYSVAVRGRRHTWTRTALGAVGPSAAMHVSARVPGHDLFVIKPSRDMPGRAHALDVRERVVRARRFHSCPC